MNKYIAAISWAENHVNDRLRPESEAVMLMRDAFIAGFDAAVSQCALISEKFATDNSEGDGFYIASEIREKLS